MQRSNAGTARTKAKQRGVTAISVCGYKSIKTEQRIEIRPLTILAGANSSGKSSLMQPLLLLKQTLEAPYDPGALLIDGPNVRFTSTDQMLARSAGRQCADSFFVEVEIDRTYRVKLTFRALRRKGFTVDSLVYHRDGTVQKISMGMRPEEILAILPPRARFAQQELNRSQKIKTEWAVDRDRCFLYIALKTLGEPERYVVLPDVTRSGALPFLIERVIHVPGLRANPARTYKTTSIGPEFPGTFDNYVASVINSWQSTGAENLRLLGRALERLGLTWKVEARQFDDTQVELRVGRLPHSLRGGAHDLVSIADVGFGVSQALPVVAALLAAGSGELVYLEQPEIHLHPKAQSSLARLLAEAAKRGVNVVAETHSSLVLRAVQTLVAQGELSPDLVKLHWFQRNPDEGSTEVVSADLDEHGAFGQWPEDFDDVSLDSERSYLDAVESRSLAK
jgi:predicted ATPase